jgi:pimeloyl-ACP methyl ester carboxylesterase
VQSGPHFDRSGASVWVLHGFFASKHWVSPLSSKLHRLGWETACYGYPSVWSRITDEGKRLADGLGRAYQATGKPVYLVGHSMGGIVARVAALELGPSIIQKLVLVCSPNHGSHVASKVDSWLGVLFPMLAEMSDRASSYVRCLPPPNVPCAIIAAKNDLVVRPESTKIEGVEEWMMVPGMHSAAVWRDDVAVAIDNYFCTGKFVLV